jgi:hypothetical protein
MVLSIISLDWMAYPYLETLQQPVGYLDDVDGSPFEGCALTCGMGMAIKQRLILKLMEHYTTFLWRYFEGASPFHGFCA